MEFQFYKMKGGPEKDGGDGCTTAWMSLMPQNRALKKGSDAKLCHVYFTTIKKKLKRKFGGLKQQ